MQWHSGTCRNTVTLLHISLFPAWDQQSESAPKIQIGASIPKNEEGWIPFGMNVYVNWVKLYTIRFLCGFSGRESKPGISGTKGMSGTTSGATPTTSVGKTGYLKHCMLSVFGSGTAESSCSEYVAFIEQHYVQKSRGIVTCKCMLTDLSWTVYDFCGILQGGIVKLVCQRP